MRAAGATHGCAAGAELGAVQGEGAKSPQSCRPWAREDGAAARPQRRLGRGRVQRGCGDNDQTGGQLQPALFLPGGPPGV